MKELRAENVVPRFVVLENTLDPRREEYHIRKMRRLGYPLVNKHLTGVYKTKDYRQPKLTPEQKQAAKAARIALSNQTAATLSWKAQPLGFFNQAI